MENIFKVGDFVRIKEGTPVSTCGDFDVAPHEWCLYETPRVVAINYINNTLYQSVLEPSNTFDDEISESDEEISILF